MATKRTTHSVKINGKSYTQPKMSVNAYMRYLETRESVMDTEGRNGLYSAAQFQEMMDCIVEVYGNQFTIEEMTDEKTGLSVGEIMAEFAAIELGVAGDINGRMEKMKENFQNGK